MTPTFPLARWALTTWRTLFLIGAALEIATLVDRVNGDTLSEVLRATLRYDPTWRYALWMSWAWLTWHWMLRRRTSVGLHWQDAVAVLLGLVVAWCEAHRVA